MRSHNALAETVNGLDKTELIRRRGPWRTADQVELATAAWVAWWNEQGLHSACGDPAEFEAAYHSRLPATPRPPGRQALATAIFARTDATRFEQLEHELTSDAIELGLDAALPAVFELNCTIAEFGRGERARPDKPGTPHRRS